MSIVAILVDGGFYRKRARYLFGEKKAKERADELVKYCNAHLKNKDGDTKRELYRIFYYDCPPYDKSVFHPFLKKNVNLKKTDLYVWSSEFLDQLKSKRKVALRLGKLSDVTARYQLTKEAQLQLFRNKIKLSQIKENDFELFIEQKGVDMKIGIDIASLAYKKQVNQIILISADSDFVPAAKLARREGIDFILDPMWSTIKPELYEHIDGLQSQFGKKHKESKDSKDLNYKQEE